MNAIKMGVYVQNVFIGNHIKTKDQKSAMVEVVAIVFPSISVMMILTKCYMAQKRTALATGHILMLNNNKI
jgi:chromate transport protein ChrA